MSAPSYTPQLRPLSVGEMLDAGFRLFRARFGTLMVCVLVPILPFTLLGTILQASIDDTAFDVNGSSATARVRRGDDGPTETMQFTQERGEWRATALSSS